MGQHYLPQASVLCASIFFAFLVLVAYGQSDCELGQYRSSSSTTDVTIFIEETPSCIVQNFSVTNNLSSITVTGLQPGVTYNFKINCSGVCCDYFTTSPAKVESITVQTVSNGILNVNWTAPSGRVDFYIVNMTSAEQNITQNQNCCSSSFSNLSAGRVYNFTVTSVSGTLQNISSTVSFATKPNPPEALWVSGFTNTSISLLWSRPQLMNGVNVSYEVLYTFNQSCMNSTSSSLNLALSGLLSGTQYVISVVTVGVQNLKSSPVQLTTYTAPNAVQNLRTPAVSNNSVNLTWVSPNGNSSLFIYVINITTFNQALNTTSNNYQITQMQPGTQYICSVTTYIMNSNISGPSQSIQCNTKPLPVTNLNASRIGTTGMWLSWSRQSDYKSTYVYNVSVNGGQRIQNSSETAYVFNLTSGSNYMFTVQTIANGISSEPVYISAFTGLDKASIISAVGTTDRMTVAWTPPNGTVSLYSIKILLSGTVHQTKNQTNETSVVFSDLLPGTLYSVVVVSISGPIKEESNSVQNATLPTPPRELAVTARSSTSLNINWAQPLNMSSGSYSFLLQYSSTNQSSSINCSQNYGFLTYLSAGVLYNINVKTVGAMGYFSTPQYLTAYTNPSAVSQLKVNNFTENSIFLIWEQNDEQQNGYSYLVQFRYPNNTDVQMTVNNTSAQLLSLKSASQYSISITTQTADGTKSDPQFITAYSKPYPVSAVRNDSLNVTAISLSWNRPPEYHIGFSYRIFVSNCKVNNSNLSTSTETITVTGLQPGTLCLFSVYSIANNISGDPTNISVFTKPSMVLPKVDNQGSNQSLLVKWDQPEGGLDLYILNISSIGWYNSKTLNTTENNYTFTQLKAATVYTVTLTTVKGTYQETSGSVNNATYPNKPGGIKVSYKSSNSLSLQWEKAQNMTAGSFNYSLNYWPGNNSTQKFSTPNNTFCLGNLQSGTSYNVSVFTVGPMGFESEPVFKYPITTIPDPVQNLQVVSTATENISVVWVNVTGVPKYVVSVYTEKAEHMNFTTNSSTYTLNNLIPSTQYNISVRSRTSDDTDGPDVSLKVCTDAAPVGNLTCTGPNLTRAMLTFSWSPPPGGYQAFGIKLSSNNSQNYSTTSFNYSFTGLEYYTQYNATLWTMGCGKSSTLQKILCRTGITRPVQPVIEKAVNVIDKKYNTFTLRIQPEVFNNSNGPVLYYGVLVSSTTIVADGKMEFGKYLLYTYEQWKAKQCSTYLAIVKEMGNRSVDEHTIVIGDQAKSKVCQTESGYVNGELDAKGSYSFAIVTFTHLVMTNKLVNESYSYYSISKFYQSTIILPENPVVICGAAAGVSVAALFIVIIIGVVACRRKGRKDDSSSVPIHSIRNKVSNPIKVEDYEAYYKRQRADSFCGFAEEFEDLRPVGINQAKAIAQAPENKSKNRYNNVLPYDSSRVKLSMLNSQFDDYINANYMPGYTIKKEFIAAQGPLPCTVNDFWRMVWEKNIYTIVMLTKCNEQGRVKCEKYWPAEMNQFNHLKVTTISEIPLEDWTIRDFEVKNAKTGEARSVRHFHFTAWPDHGVPETTELLINFRHLVREHMDQYSRHSPTLVHCSAGVGRTGTLIAIDRLIFQIEREGVVDVFGIIHDLRMHRPLMVQTEDQYVFLNQCAMDFIRSRTGNNVDLIYQNTAALSIYQNFEPSKKSKNGYHKA
ncbi:receptor-type tyrosine-protein phosphatase eta isoform X2 [Paramisgurnus dabryanus]|uniref:receptor-type tyrosine-protein phosphatase eta isoform X2 n=1 Tax=Paramisgurnus dabryanus TaxID=90735 RepID=UPI003CCF0645